MDRVTAFGPPCDGRAGAQPGGDARRRAAVRSSFDHMSVPARTGTGRHLDDSANNHHPPGTGRRPRLVLAGLGHPGGSVDLGCHGFAGRRRDGRRADLVDPGARRPTRHQQVGALQRAGHRRGHGRHPRRGRQGTGRRVPAHPAQQHPDAPAARQIAAVHPRRRPAHRLGHRHHQRRPAQGGGVGRLAGRPMSAVRRAATRLRRQSDRRVPRPRTGPQRRTPEHAAVPAGRRRTGTHRRRSGVDRAPPPRRPAQAPGQPGDTRSRPAAAGGDVGGPRPGRRPGRALPPSRLRRMDQFRLLQRRHVHGALPPAARRVHLGKPTGHPRDRAARWQHLLLQRHPPERDRGGRPARNRRLGEHRRDGRSVPGRHHLHQPTRGRGRLGQRRRRGHHVRTRCRPGCRPYRRGAQPAL